jgi:cis-3-alkyl-4-acyloxetan-2-one decarboxylase
MNSIDHGNGPPVVCVHGNPTWSFYYRNLVKKLSDRYRVIVPDHIGCGLSDKPGDTMYHYTLSNRIEDLVTLLNRLIPGQPYRLVVHDWGGMIGLGAAIKHPDRIQQLVILNTSGFLLPKTRSFHGVLRFARSPAGGVMIRCFNSFLRGALRWGCTNKSLSANVRKMYLKPYNSPANRLAIQRFVQDIPLKPGDAAYDAAKTVDNQLHTLKHIPKRVIWGRKDFIFDDAFLNEWKRRCPEAQVDVLENAGHLVLEDAPESVCKLIDAFFDTWTAGD